MADRTLKYRYYRMDINILEAVNDQIGLILNAFPRIGRGKSNDVGARTTTCFKTGKRILKHDTVGGITLQALCRKQITLRIGFGSRHLPVCYHSGKIIFKPLVLRKQLSHFVLVAACD